jgi:hypothetical protein
MIVHVSAAAAQQQQQLFHACCLLDRAQNALPLTLLIMTSVMRPIVAPVRLPGLGER